MNIKNFGIIFLFSTLSLPAIANNEATLFNSVDHQGQADGSNSAEKYEKQVTCALKASGAESAKQLERVKYVSKALGTIFAQLSPEVKAGFVHHMLAQGSAETDNLRLIEEEKPNLKTTKPPHHGRGLSQTTHVDNYAKLAGCEKVTNSKPFPAKIQQTEMAKAPKLKSSDVVSNPANVINEKNDRGKKLLALGALCYFLDTKARHPKFAKALEGTSDSDINTVGVALNHGPGAIGKGKLPNGTKKRLKAFKNMKSCFNNG